MNRIAIYAAAAIAIVVPAILLGSTLFASEEDRLDTLVGRVESARLDALLDSAAFDEGGLVVSAGREQQRFGASDRDAARSLLEEATGIQGARNVHVRQRQVTLRDQNATAILNVELDDGDWVALRVELARHADRWMVERIRVMG